MAMLRTIIWVLIFATLAAFSAANWQPVEVRIWEGLAMPNAVWRRRDLRRHVASLSEQLGHRDQVLAALRNEPILDLDEREFALRAAQSLPEHTGNAELQTEVWKVVQTRDAGKDAYTYSEGVEARSSRGGWSALSLRPRNAGTRLDAWGTG